MGFAAAVMMAVAPASSETKKNNLIGMVSESCICADWPCRRACHPIYI